MLTLIGFLMMVTAYVVISLPQRLPPRWRTIIGGFLFFGGMAIILIDVHYVPHDAKGHPEIPAGRSATVAGFSFVGWFRITIRNPF